MIRLHSILTRRFLFTILTLWTGSVSLLPGAGLKENRPRPNIVWLVSEDNAKSYLSLYNEHGAAMPTVERLAESGIVFENAFSNAPVCSVARTTLITGCYAPRIGGQFHRRTETVPVPEGLRLFPAYLQEAGYYTSNNSKTDYNVENEGVWDESSNAATYRNRADGQPFFHVQNFGITHESSLHFTVEEMASNPVETDLVDIRLPPYFPNTPTFRYTYARYLDLHRRLDEQLAKFVGDLEKDGLMDDTIIFYYGDHGGVLPRSKGYLYESGLAVPLVVYIPEKWRSLSPFETGSRQTAFVEFVDFGPTVMKLAGLDTPSQMDGSPFLGEGVSLKKLEKRNQAFGYADRFDEKLSMVRSLREGRFKYIRAFEPFNFDGLRNEYRYRMLAYQEWWDLWRSKRLLGASRLFFEPRATESLYDLQSDPDETRNLVGESEHSGVLKRLRSDLMGRMKSMPDLSLYPESYLVEHALDAPVEFGQEHQSEIARLLEVVNYSLLDYKKAKRRIAKALESNAPWERYWAIIAASSFGEQAIDLAKPIDRLADEDPELLVRVRAAEFLGLLGDRDPVPVITAALRNARSEIEATEILNTAELLHSFKGYEFDLDESLFSDEWLSAPGDHIRNRLQALSL